ncbi:MAG TPA: hypothetical protein VFG83_11595 [Kofleriaceae bacterium]|nr:hypothetical protein [Kofleriaceae bacterium]
MGKAAELRDGQGMARITFTAINKEGHLRQMAVTIAGRAHEAHALVTPGSRDPAVEALEALLESPDDTGSFSIWGDGHDNTETDVALLTCAFAGDGNGHFSVALSFADGDVRVSDRFLTDDAALRRFVADLRSLG